MTKRIYGIYDDEEILMQALPALKAAGVKCKDVQSPFPIHGIEPLLDIPRTRISIVSFLFGLSGTSFALWMVWYMMIHDWPINIGGKPNFMLYMNLPAFIPVTFELTVFCAAHGMALTFLLRSKLIPGVRPFMPHSRITDDKFVLHVEVKDELQTNEIASLIRSSGASDVLLKPMHA